MVEQKKTEKKDKPKPEGRDDDKTVKRKPTWDRKGKPEQSNR